MRRAGGLATAARWSRTEHCQDPDFSAAEKVFARLGRDRNRLLRGWRDDSREGAGTGACAMRRAARPPHAQWRPGDHRGRLGLRDITEDGLFPGTIRILAETQGSPQRRTVAVLQYAMWSVGLTGRRGWSTARFGVQVRCWLPAALRRESEPASPSRRTTCIASSDQFEACRCVAPTEPQHSGSHRCFQGWIPPCRPCRMQSQGVMPGDPSHHVMLCDSKAVDHPCDGVSTNTQSKKDQVIQRTGGLQCV